jgi:AmmeMemoRadiSam system radical SAM enzyme
VPFASLPLSERPVALFRYIDAAAREELYTFMDAANVDLKAFTEAFYKRLCTGHLGAVLETLEYLKYRTKVWFEITTLLIPGHNDSPEEVKKLSEWVMTRPGPDVPLHFTAFHPDYKMLDLPCTPAFTLTRARDFAREVGLHVVYTGNVHDETGQSTYCPGCGNRIIGRDWYDITTWRLTGDGRCGICATAIPGLFEARPGSWGRRRAPIRIGSRHVARSNEGRTHAAASHARRRSIPAGCPGFGKEWARTNRGGACKVSSRDLGGQQSDLLHDRRVAVSSGGLG